MHYRLWFSSKLENPSVYIECSVRKPGIRHPVREIVKRFGKKKITVGILGNLLAKNFPYLNGKSMRKVKFPHIKDLDLMANLDL